MNKPLVSIITPAYKCKDTIKDTYESIKNQTFLSWEWIIAEDSSNDGTYEYIKELVINDNRVTLLQTEKNGGTAVARNVALKNANGRYITFLDADDLLDPNYLECQLEFMKDHGPLISAAYRRKGSKTCTEFYVPDKVDYKKALKGNPLSCLTTMYDKDVIGEHYFNESLRKREDYVFWLDILKRGIVARGNPKVLATYNILEGSKSRNKFKLIKYMYTVYHKTQGFNWFISWCYVIRWAFYGLRKYKNVR